MQNDLKALIALSFWGGACLHFCPEGGVRRIMSILFTALLIAGIAAPLRNFDYDSLSLGEAKLSGAEAEILQRSRESEDLLTKELLRGNCERYITQKAEAGGLRVESVSVTLRQDDYGNWTPYAAAICAYGAEESAEELCRLIRDELGIPTERQVWELNE